MKLKDRAVTREEDTLVFDAALLAGALRYHLRDSGLPNQAALAEVAADVASIELPRKTWVSMTDDQRLAWLLEATGQRAPVAPRIAKLEAQQ